MAAQQYSALLLVVIAVSALLVASPAIQQFIVAPPTTPLTELSLFGSYNNATYPFNVTAGQTYPLYIDVKNHLGSCTYYLIEVKFRNQTQSGPDTLSLTSSALLSLANFYFSVANNQVFELPIKVAFQYNVDTTNPDQLDMQTLMLNGYSLHLSSTTIAWDPTIPGFYGNIFFELWIFNNTANAFQYNQRYVRPYG